MSLNSILRYGLLSQVSPSIWDGLKGYWTFDDTLNDELNKNNGVLTSTISYVTGMNNKGIKYTSSSSLIKLRDNGYGYFNDQSYSINAWVYSVGNAFLLWSYDYTSQNPPYYAQQIRFGTDILLGTNANGVYTYIVSSYNTLPINEWVMVTCCNNRNNLKMYVNSSKVTSFRATDTDPDNDIIYYNQEVTIGKSLNISSINSYNSQLDELAYWGRELSDDEVTELYNSGNGKFY